jgi:hypothetical protein
MTEHIERQYELPARAPACRRGGAARANGTGARRGNPELRRVVRLGAAMSVALACASPARAQAGDPPADVAAPAAAADAAAGDPPPLADDDAASATGPAQEEDAPWNQGVAVDQRRAAREVFLEANGLARKRFFATAAAKYRQAIELWPHPAFSYNLALAQLQLDQPIEAHASLRRAVEHGPAPVGDRYDQARQQIARIESELGAIEVTCAEPGARVMLDGKLVFTGPGVYRGVVRPGAHQVVAIRRGLAPVVEQLVVSPGEHGGVALVFEYPEVEVAVPVRRWAAWQSYAVVGAGAALVLAGSALDWHSTRMFDEHDRDFHAAFPTGYRADTATEADRRVRAELDDRLGRAESEQRMAVIGYAVGGATLATGAVLAYLGRERTYRKRVRVAPGEDAANAPSTTTSSVAPLIAPGVIGVSAGFHF